MTNMSVAFTRAFEVWENEFRANPEKFMTAEATAAMEVLPLSAQRTVCFEAILDRLAAGEPWDHIGSSPTVPAVTP